MKKLLTIALAIFAISSVAAQPITVAKHKLALKKDNMTFSIAYPSFTAGRYADTLNTVTYDMFTAVSPIKPRPIVRNEAELNEMFFEMGKKLKEIGLTKSIDAIDYAHIAGWQFFQNKYIATLIINQYIDMQAAHPTIVCQDVNIDLTSGRDFDPFQLVRDTARLMDIAGQIFCKERKLPANALRIQTGLNCEVSDLPMANICGFTQKGFVLFYNRGEVANHSMPAISIVIPYSEFKDMLPADFFEGVYQVRDGEQAGQALIRELHRGDQRYIRKKQNRGGYRKY